MKNIFTESLESRFLKYSVAAGAVLLGIKEADAQVSGTSVNQTIHNSTYTISFNGNNRFRFSQSTYTNILGTTNKGSIKPLSIGAGWIKTGSRPKALTSGYVVSAGKSFAVPGNTNVNRFLSYIFTNIGPRSSTPLGSSFVGKGNKYIGVKFKISGSTYYGWIKVNVPSRVADLQIISYAYDLTADNSITANGTLPVELTTFTANNEGGKVELKWNTATEVNNYGFDIERNKYPDFKNGEKVSVSQWEKIGFVKGSGNSNSLKEYSFTDNAPPAGLVMYRLKQIDNNGSFKYSKIVTVNYLPAKFALLQNYPNPFNPTTTIQYAVPKAEHVTLRLYDEIGREVATLVNENKEAGRYNVQFNGSGLASGIYYYRLNAGSFNKVKKLMLLK